MTLYCDSSSLIKLHVAEPETQAVRQQVQAASIIVTSSIALVEVRTALSRSFRERRLTRSGLETAKAQFAADWTSFVSVSPDSNILRTAADLAERHALRALDSVHLASFQQVLERTDDDVEFSSFDERLIKAARKLR